MGGGQCAECQKKHVNGQLLRAKLAISEPGDAYEQEADRVAEQVMRISPADVSRRRNGSRTQPLVQRRASSGATGLAEVPPIIHEVLSSPGQSLEPRARAFFEPRFGQDFSQVRVHTDITAAESARAVNALAYTVGRDVVFGEGQYVPHTNEGRILIAHELTHVVQEPSSGLRAKPGLFAMGKRGDVHEWKAGAIAAQVASRETVDASFAQKPANHFSSSAVSLRRQAGANEPSDGSVGCTVGAGISSGTCSAYAANRWWLPFAYVNNATCACIETPNVPTAKCVRKFLQDRLATAPGWLKTAAALQKPNDNPLLPTYPAYQAFVQTFLAPRIYQDHVDAYVGCCCPSGPAAYPAWVGVTTVPLPCAGVGAAIRLFGSCHGTPGAW